MTAAWCWQQLQRPQMLLFLACQMELSCQPSQAPLSLITGQCSRVCGVEWCSGQVS